MLIDIPRPLFGSLAYLLQGPPVRPCVSPSIPPSHLTWKEETAWCLPTSWSTPPGFLSKKKKTPPGFFLRVSAAEGSFLLLWAGMGSREAPPNSSPMKGSDTPSASARYSSTPLPQISSS